MPRKEIKEFNGWLIVKKKGKKRKKRKKKTKIQEKINLQSLKEAENFGILETTSRTVHDLQFERKTSRK